MKKRARYFLERDLVHFVASDIESISSRNLRYIVSHDVLDEVAKAVDPIQRASTFVAGHMKRNRVSLLMIHKEVCQADSIFHLSVSSVSGGS